jgi:hypothetical protein
MNLAIEYMMRTRLPQHMLKLPCSIFLYNVFNESSRLAVTIQNCYGKPDEILVKHWHLDKITKDKVMPPNEEYIVAKKDMFSSPFVVIDDYNTIGYAANPYPTSMRQSPDEPYASSQQAQYQEYLDKFFNSSVNESKRKNWLWKSFASSFFPETMKSDFGYMSPESQRDSVQNICPIPWKGWCMWTSQMLLYYAPSPASEIVFAPLYQEKLSTNERYKELIKNFPVPDRPKFSRTPMNPPPSSWVTSSVANAWTGNTVITFTTS